MSAFRIPDGHGTAFTTHSPSVASRIEVVGRFAGRNRARYVAVARQRLQCLGVEEAVLSPEGAVHEAWVRLYEQIRAGEDPPIATQEECDSVLIRLVKLVVCDKSRWQKAGKRRPPERDHGQLARLEAPDPQLRAPDEEVGDREHFERLLARLGTGKKGRMLRQIVELRMDGYSIEEIARQLGLSVKTVDWRLRQVRSILGPYLGRKA